MLRLESKILQREFVVHENTLYASQIRNVLSGRDFVPDGNSVEFLFHFTDGSEFSSKGLNVIDSNQENGKLSFKFEETQGIAVTMTFWVGEDGNTLQQANKVLFNQVIKLLIISCLNISVSPIQKLILQCLPILKVLNLTVFSHHSVSRFILTHCFSDVNSLPHKI